MVVVPIVASSNLISVVVVAIAVVAFVAVAFAVNLRRCCDGVKLAFVKECKHSATS